MVLKRSLNDVGESEEVQNRSDKVILGLRLIGVLIGGRELFVLLENLVENCLRGGLLAFP